MIFKLFFTLSGIIFSVISVKADSQELTRTFNQKYGDLINSSFAPLNIQINEFNNSFLPRYRDLTKYYYFGDQSPCGEKSSSTDDELTLLLPKIINRSYSLFTIELKVLSNNKNKVLIEKKYFACEKEHIFKEQIEILGVNVGPLNADQIHTHFIQSHRPTKLEIKTKSFEIKIIDPNEGEIYTVKANRESSYETVITFSIKNLDLIKMSLNKKENEVQVNYLNPDSGDPKIFKIKKPTNHNYFLDYFSDNNELLSKNDFDLQTEQNNTQYILTAIKGNLWPSYFKKFPKKIETKVSQENKFLKRVEEIQLFYKNNENKSEVEQFFEDLINDIRTGNVIKQ